MAMNRVQFQPGLSLMAFLQDYGTQEACESALFEARWPTGFVCPRCEGQSCSTFVRGSQQLWQCTGCRRCSRRGGQRVLCAHGVKANPAAPLFEVASNFGNVPDVGAKPA